MHAGNLFQGPSKFNEEDLPALELHSHKFFFARKFHTQTNETTRLKFMERTQNDHYKQLMTPLLTDKIVRYVLVSGS